VCLEAYALAAAAYARRVGSPAIHQPFGGNVLNAGTLVPVTKNILSEIITRQANDATIK
jgi:hypothetical protein